MFAAAFANTAKDRASRSSAVRVRGAASLACPHLPCLTLLPYPGAGLTVRAAGDGGTVF